MPIPGRSGGLEKALVLFGGAHPCDLTRFACVGDQSQPLNDIWLVDVSEAQPAARASTDLAASFDGEDDIISLTLPAWCADTEALNVLWLDVWMFYTSPEGKTTVLFDTSSVTNAPLLRWQLEATEGSVYGILLLNPGPAQVVVRRWGPLQVRCKGVWRHVAFTLRTARMKNPINVSPQLSIAQAYMFVDGERVLEEASSGGAGSRSLHRLSEGICNIVVAGQQPTNANRALENLNGQLDNVRIWWPACPAASDPSKCNPYAFASQLRDGTVMPEARDAHGRPIGDTDVTLEMVAAPVLLNMLHDDILPAHEAQLLIHLKFDGQRASHSVLHNDASGGPACPASSAEAMMPPPVCEGCKEECRWDNGLAVDLDWVASSGSDVAAIKTIAGAGTCQCRNVEDCPSDIRECRCPAGLHRVCRKCVFAGLCYCNAEPGAFCAEPMETLLAYGLGSVVWSSGEWFGCSAPETDIPGICSAVYPCSSCTLCCHSHTNLHAYPPFRQDTYVDAPPPPHPLSVSHARMHANALPNSCIVYPCV